MSSDSDYNIIGSIVRIVLSNGFYYKGRVLSETDSQIIIFDTKGSKVTINKNSVVVQEVLN